MVYKQEQYEQEHEQYQEYDQHGNPIHRDDQEIGIKYIFSNWSHTDRFLARPQIPDQVLIGYFLSQYKAYDQVDQAYEQVYDQEPGQEQVYDDQQQYEQQGNEQYEQQEYHHEQVCSITTNCSFTRTRTSSEHPPMFLFRNTINRIANKNITNKNTKNSMPIKVNIR